MTWGDGCVPLWNGQNLSHRQDIDHHWLQIFLSWEGASRERRESCRMCFWMVKPVSCSTPLVRTNISREGQLFMFPRGGLCLILWLPSYLSIRHKEARLLIFVCVCVCPGWHVVKSELKQLLDFRKKTPTSVLVPGCQRLLRQSFSTVSVGSKALSIPEWSHKPRDAECCGPLWGNVMTTKVNFNDSGYIINPPQ